MTAEKITLDSLTRQEQLVIWLMRKGMSQTSIAKMAGTTPQSVARWFAAETINPIRHDQLVKMGIPAELLPPAAYKLGGKTYPQDAVANA